MATTRPVTTMEPDDNNDPKGKKPVKPTDDNEFAMPEFTSDEHTADTSTVHHNGNTISEGTLSLDDLNNIGFDNQRDEEERAKLNAPVGDWIKEDRWPLTKRVNTNDCAADDIDPTGRTILSFMGKPTAREANGLEYQPTMFLRVSPDRRYKQDKPTEVDMAYKLFLKAKDLYIELNSEKATNLRQLITMLEEDSFVVRTMNGDSGPIIVDVKAKRKQR